MKVQLSLIVMFLLVLSIGLAIPATAEQLFDSSQPSLLAVEADETEPVNPDTVSEQQPAPITAPVPANNPGSAPATPKPTLARALPTATPSAVTIENINAGNPDTIHNQDQSSYIDSDFKLWLNHYTLRDLFDLKDRFWGDIPFYAGFWALIFLLAVMFYLLKWKHLRQPLLFISTIFFGFFLGGVPNPVNGIFEVLINHQVLLNIVLILLPVLISIIWGRFYCGWICPLGAIQEFLNPAPEGRSLPQPLDRILKYLKYVVLIIFGYLSWHSTHNLWQQFDPAFTLFGFSGSMTAIIILAVFFIVSILVSRPFCRYFCPLGAILAITSKLALFRMRADAKKCMVCGKCRLGECPMDAISAFNPEIDLPSIDNSECIKCSYCQKYCRKSALRVTGFKIDHTYTASDQYTGNLD